MAEHEKTTGIGSDTSVSQLLDALESHGLEQEREEVLQMARYIDSVEDKLSQMMDTLQEMRDQVRQLQDKSLAGRCGKLVSTAEEKLQQSRSTVQGMKDRFLRAVHGAVANLQEKGREALRRTVQEMKIPSALEQLSTSFRQAAQSMGEIAQELDTMRERLHTSKQYLKNAVRVLLGRSAQETSALEADKGVLAKLRGLAEGLESSFDGLAQSTEVLQTRLEPEHQQEAPVPGEPVEAPEQPPEETTEETQKAAPEEEIPKDWILSPQYTQAGNLPDGWQWVDYGDGSGHLQAPNGEEYFEYDRQPYSSVGGIGYKGPSDHYYRAFWGTMEDFKSYAESQVNEYLPQQNVQNSQSYAQETADQEITWEPDWEPEL